MRAFIRGVLVLLGAALAAVFVLELTSFPSSGDWVGKSAPPTQGTDAQGAAFRLSDSLGEVVLLDFWGSW